jgi:hypothetical protein
MICIVIITSDLALIWFYFENIIRSILKKIEISPQPNIISLKNLK